MLERTQKRGLISGRVRGTLLIAVSGVVALPVEVSAHSGEAPAPEILWTSWSLDPLTIMLVLSALILYTRGLNRIWRRAGRGRGVRAYQSVAFYAAMTLLIVAVILPLDVLSEALFSAHMVQHLLLILGVAPLLVVARPAVPVLWAMPREWRRVAGRLANSGAAPRRLWAVLTTPLVAWILHALAIWIWHMPLFYEAAVRSWFMHLTEHAMFLGTATLFWWSILPATGLEGAARRGIAVFSLFTTALHSGLLAALITFSQSPWYTSHANAIEFWGLTPLQDQQLAGLVMWVPMGAMYTITAALVLSNLLNQLARDEPAYVVRASDEHVTESH